MAEEKENREDPLLVRFFGYLDRFDTFIHNKKIKSILREHGVRPSKSNVCVQLVVGLMDGTIPLSVLWEKKTK